MMKEIREDTRQDRYMNMLILQSLFSFLQVGAMILLLFNHCLLLCFVAKRGCSMMSYKIGECGLLNLFMHVKQNLCILRY